MFLEERITEKALYGSSFDESYAVDQNETRGGNTYRKLLHPYPKLRYTLNLLDYSDTIAATVLDLYHRSGGTFGGFRARHHQDYSTNGYTGTPTYNDQACTLISAGVYQATKWYGTEGDSTATRRRLLKLVAGTQLVGIRDDFGNPVQQTNGFTVDINTGQIAFDANKAYPITGITQAVQAEVAIGAHTLAVDDTLHVGSVVGMTEINGLRGTVVATGPTSVTLDIDSSGFTTYTSGGDVNTRPQVNETVTCGCEFDIPVGFESDLSGVTHTSYKVLSATAVVVELLKL
jgi:hypothetical protein